MPLTITLHRIADDRAEARQGDTLLAGFDPRALLVDQPLHPSQPLPADPVAYGRRLWAAIGGPALAALIAELPLAPNPDSLIALRTNDAALAGIPWEYLHSGAHAEAFLMFDYLLVREIPVVDMPGAPDPALPWRLVAQGSDPLLQEVRDAAGVLRGYAPLPRLRVVRELDALGKSLHEQQPAPPIRWQRIAPTRAALNNLATNEPLLFHFTGHGNVENGQPTLCFDDGTGRLDSRPVRDLAARLRGRACLAFLNACRTADSAEPGANLALALVQAASRWCWARNTACSTAWPRRFVGVLPAPGGGRAAGRGAVVCALPAARQRAGRSAPVGHPGAVCRGRLRMAAPARPRRAAGIDRRAAAEDAGAASARSAAWPRA